jgi:hypothetical protein
MDSATQISSLVTEIGPRDEDIEGILELSAGLWLVRYEDLDIEIEHDEGRGRLMLSTNLGPVRQEQKLPVYEAALAFATMWRETGGVRIGLPETNGSLVMMVDIDTADLTAGALAAVVANVAAKTRIWRVVVASGGNARPEETSFDPHSINVVRA